MIHCFFFYFALFAGRKVWTSLWTPLGQSFQRPIWRFSTHCRTIRHRFVNSLRLQNRPRSLNRRILQGINSARKKSLFCAIFYSVLFIERNVMNSVQFRLKYYKKKGEGRSYNNLLTIATKQVPCAMQNYLTDFYYWIFTCNNLFVYNFWNNDKNLELCYSNITYYNWQNNFSSLIYRVCMFEYIYLFD